jgi:predicted RNA-binding protein with RPS1 domain
MKPAHIKINDLRKEPKESITKKLLNISSKRKISLSIKN